MTYRCFCNSCGKRFASDLPERDSKGCLNNDDCVICALVAS